MKAIKRFWVKVVLLMVLVLCAVVGVTTLSKTKESVPVGAESTSDVFTFSVLNDTECSVRLSDRTIKTAIIPETAEINGKEYAVTATAVNGFASAPNLERVRLPKSLKTVGQASFGNCSALKSISLHSVEAIGAQAFAMTKMEYLIIPNTVKTVSAYILRGCNTKVYARADLPNGVSVPYTSWSSNWNGGNSNQDVEFSSDFIPELKYIEADETLPQARNSVFSATEPQNFLYVADYQEYTEEDAVDEVYIPAQHVNDEGILCQVIGIKPFAFWDCSIKKLVIGYSDISFNIPSMAFLFTYLEKVVINREITLDGEDDFGNEAISGNVFGESSELSSVILPTLMTTTVDAKLSQYQTVLGKDMFSGCIKLAHVSFIEPRFMPKAEEFKLADQEIDCKISFPQTGNIAIGDGAFTLVHGVKEVCISENVTFVGRGVFGKWSHSKYNQIINIIMTGANRLDGWNSAWSEDCEEEAIKYIWSTHTINYHANKPSIASHDVVGENYSITYSDISSIQLEPCRFSLTGWHFIGWSDKADGSGNFYLESDLVDVATIDGQQLDLYAQWKQNQYKVRYFANSSEIGNQYIAMGDDWHYYEVPWELPGAAFARVSFYMSAWQLAYGKYYSLGESVSRLSDSDGATVTLSAVWIEKALSECVNQWGEYEIATKSQFQSLNTISTINRTFLLLQDLDFSNQAWSPIENFEGTLEGNNHQITYRNDSISNNENFGLFKVNHGIIQYLNVKPYIQSHYVAENSSTVRIPVGGIAGENYGTIQDCDVLSYIGTGNESYSNHNFKVDIYVMDSTQYVGGVAGIDYGTIVNCNNYASIGGESLIGGIVGALYSKCTIQTCKNYGTILYHMTSGRFICMGGIAGVMWYGSAITRSTSAGQIIFAYVTQTPGARFRPEIGIITGRKEKTATISDCFGGNKVVITDEVRSSLSSEDYAIYTYYVSNDDYGNVFTGVNPDEGESGGGSCIAEGTLITLADGRQVPVESLTGNESLLVWNLYTGTFDSAPILFIDKDASATYRVINLAFSDGTGLKVISEHGLWDYNLNRYVYLDEDAAQYIGHWFNKQTTDGGVMISSRVQLTGVTISMEETVAYSPVTYEHLCYYVNGLLSMPGGIDGLFNIFEVDAETMRYDAAAMEADIEQYGLFTYEEFAQMLNVPQEVYDAFNAQYFKIAIGKGIVTEERLAGLAERYARQLGID